MMVSGQGGPTTLVGLTLVSTEQTLAPKQTRWRTSSGFSSIEWKSMEQPHLLSDQNYLELALKTSACERQIVFF